MTDNNDKQYGSEKTVTVLVEGTPHEWPKGEDMGLNRKRRANYANSQCYKAQNVSDDIFRRFEGMFKEVNKRFAWA